MVNELNDIDGACSPAAGRGGKGRRIVKTHLSSNKANRAIYRMAVETVHFHRTAIRVIRFDKRASAKGGSANTPY